jgi:hypothetical protein
VEDAVLEDESDLTRLVRSLQRLDGVRDCFRSGQTDCDGVGCVWSEYCHALPAEAVDASGRGKRPGDGR